MSLHPMEHWCTSLVALIPPTDFEDDGVDALCPYCSMDLRVVLGRGDHLRCPLCGDSCVEESTQLCSLAARERRSM